MARTVDWLDEETELGQVDVSKDHVDGTKKRFKLVVGFGLVSACLLLLCAWWAFQPGEPRMILLDYDAQSNRALYLVVSDSLNVDYYAFRVLYMGSDNPLVAGKMIPYEFGSDNQSNFSAESHPFHTSLDRQSPDRLKIEKSSRTIGLSVMKKKPFWFSFWALFMNQSAQMEYACLPASYYYGTLK
jgi:hypothetical protein